MEGHGAMGQRLKTFTLVIQTPFDKRKVYCPAGSPDGSSGSW